MGAGCIHRSRSRHVAVLSPWWGAHLSLFCRCNGSRCSRSWHCAVRCSKCGRTCRRSRTTLGRRCSQTASAAAAAGPTRSPHWPRHPALACATSCRIRLLRCCTPVAAVAPKPLAHVAGLSALSPDRRPLRRCHFGNPPLAATRRPSRADDTPACSRIARTCYVASAGACCCRGASRGERLRTAPFILPLR